MDEQLLTGGRAVSSRQRRGAGVVVALLLGVTVVCLPFGPIQLTAHPGFLPAFGALSLLINGLTAGLLLSQTRVPGGHPSAGDAAAVLGAGYLFAALITVAQLLALPGVVAVRPVIGGTSTAVWLWCAWHAGFAAYVMRFVWWRAAPERAGSPARIATRTCLIVGGLTLLAAAGATLRPQEIGGRVDGGLVASGVGPLILVAVVTATVSAIARLRCRTVLSLWLCVALLAGCLDVTLTLAGNGRFTVGWYAARCVSLLAATCVLFALLREVVMEARRVGRANVQLEQMLHTDVLTGLANRRAFDLALDAEWRRAQREQTALSLLMIDVDSFKGFNDRYGHPAGDACLRSIGVALGSESYRPGDVAARVGGEEFGIILPVTEENGALQVAERLRASVASQALIHGGSSTGYVTISIGAATIRPYAGIGGASQLVTTADAALYQAKAAGRDTVRGCGRPPVLLAEAV